MRIERRHYPRRPARWNVSLRNTAGVELRATSVNVGPEGMQLSLDRSGLLRLCPRGHLTSRADELDLSLKVEVDDSMDAGPIAATARVCNVRRLSQFEYRLGLEFLDFPDTSDARRFERLLEGKDRAPGDDGPGASALGLNKLASG